MCWKVYTMVVVLFIFYVTVATSQEVPTPASLIAPKNYNYHPYQVQYLRENRIEPTKQGPVLFPNDAPPPPKPPLVVTSRPLTESIARSDLSENSTVAANTNKISIYDQNFAKKPENIYEEAQFGDNYVNNVEYQASTYNGIPYAGVLNNVGVNGYGSNDYSDYEQGTVLPPIYKVLEDHANQNVLELQKKRINYNQQGTALPPIYKVLDDHANQNVLELRKKQINYNQPKNIDYTNHYENNDVSNGDHNLYEDDQNQNYAFSYTVRDHDTGDDFSHSQQSSGSATNGEYRVRLPDGRTQIVSYTADENGYKANVRYDDLKTDNNNYYNINNYKNNINSNNNPNNYNSNLNNNNNYNSNPNNYNNNLNNYNNNANNYNSNPNNYNNQLINYNVNSNKQQTIPVHEDSDYNSKEYYDYSSEYNNNYQPYKTKYTFSPITTTVVVPTVRPSYEEIKDLFTQRITSTPVYTDLLVGSNNHEVKYDSTTEKVVLIGNRNIYNNLITPKQQNVVGATPASYLASTIASLRERIAAKPILSNNFINRINKYISFK